MAMFCPAIVTLPVRALVPVLGATVNVTETEPGPAPLLGDTLSHDGSLSALVQDPPVQLAGPEFVVKPADPPAAANIAVEVGVTE